MRHGAKHGTGREEAGYAGSQVNGEARSAEADYVLLKLHLALAVRRWLLRSELNWRQLEERVGDAGDVGGAGNRVRSIEHLDASVSLDLLTRALLELGATQRDIALEIVRHTRP
jgi:hypothetical protein